MISGKDIVRGDEMSNNSNNQKKQGRQIAAVCLVVCFVAALAIAGTYIFRQRDTGNSQAAADIGESGNLDSTSESTSEASRNNAGNGSDGTQTGADSTQDDTSGSTQETSSGLVMNTDENGNTTQEDTQNSGTQANEAQAQETSVSPQSGLSLEWPVDGKVLMSYSMDKTVYFKTLNQYKYNPAMLIEGKAGDEVKSSATGTIASIGVDAQTGTTVTMNVGSGYSIVYGQLKEVKVSEGDYLDAGDTIGYLSEPTKYYTEEGCNLYYQVLKNGKSVNPMDYLKEE